MTTGNTLDITAVDNFDTRLKKIDGIIRNLEYSLATSDETDKQMLMCIRMDYLKNQELNNQLDEVQRENKQMLNNLQQNCGEYDIIRCDSKMDLKTNCSTISMVHLQYKYEELLAHHNGLLKILETRNSELRKYQNENTCIKEEVEILKSKFGEVNEFVEKCKIKLFLVKKKKNEQIQKLKLERNTLRAVHNQLVTIIQKQSMEKDNYINEQIKLTPKSDKALLLTEIRKNNLLTYENIKLQQEIEYLRSLVNLPKEILSKSKV
ncbi:unnamed protein product [Brassicogethes aeneus]|uniref:Uncharacterized protein n=1 Tax=Brassicogethes aeneus TaxID=1431903 RepID=A0A9P0FAW4_BRAAE|nr:unnamed protein product [Brassicogethes aeneus]